MRPRFDVLFLLVSLVIAKGTMAHAYSMVGAGNYYPEGSFPGGGGFYPDHQQQISYKDNEYDLELKKSGDDVSVAVFAHGKFQAKIPLPDEMVQVDYILRGPANKAVVLGDASGDVQAVTVLDLVADKVADHFMAYDPTSSPDGRYIAYTKFFPPHFVENVSDEYLLYDVTRSAAANRPAGIKPDDDYNVGRPIFPLGAKNTDDDNVDIPEARQHAMASEDFYWSPDSLEYVFGDRSGTGRFERYSVVKVSVENGHPSVKVARIPIKNYCATFTTRGLPACDLMLRDIRFVQGGITGQLGGHDYPPTPGQPFSMKQTDFK